MQQERVSNQSSQAVELPPLGVFSPQEIATKSQTHWVWTPFKDINNMGPSELRSQLGYHEQRWVVLRRCTPYPLSNLTFSEVDRAVVAEVHASGFSMNFDSNTAPKIETVKYAQDQAAELGESYGDEGLRVLLPLLGVDDPTTVKRLFEVVQPFVYLIHEMESEFTKGATERIRKSDLSKADKVRAEGLAHIMRGGAVKAKDKALREYEALITSMSDAQIGKPGVSNPTAYHEWICLNLDKPLPERVNRMTQPQAGGDAALFKALLERDQERAAELAELKSQIAATTKQARKSDVDAE